MATNTMDETKKLKINSLRHIINRLERIEMQHERLDQSIKETIIFTMFNVFLNRNPAPWEIELCRTSFRANIPTFTLTYLFKNYNVFKQFERNYLKSKGISFETDDVAFKKINENVIYFDWNDSIIVESFLQSSLYEKGTVELLTRLIKKGMKVMNIGANIGYFTLLLAKWVGPTGHVFAFEPFPPNVKFLRRNIETNGYKNVEIIVKAVSNKCGKTDLWLKDSATWHFLSSKDLHGSEKLEIETITIDDFLNTKNYKTDFIMMDAEGSEKFIFEGMNKTLEKNPNLEIITEFNPFALEFSGSNGKEFLEKIEEYGFSIYLIKDSKNLLEFVTKEILLEKFPPPKSTNLYLTKDLKKFLKDL